MDTIFGLPAHPLLVHIPVVLLPLSAGGVVVIAARRAWYLRYRWVVFAVTAAGAIGATLAASAGENLERRLRDAGEQSTWEGHAQAGDVARNVSLLFLVAVAAYVLVPWISERLERRHTPSHPVGAAVATTGVRRLPRWVVAVLAAAALAAGAASVVTVIDAGHSGATSAWGDIGR